MLNFILFGNLEIRFISIKCVDFVPAIGYTMRKKKGNFKIILDIAIITNVN